MEPIVVELVLGSALGLITASASGMAAVGVNRLLRQSDELKTTVDAHGLSIAEMKTKLPNGEWKAIKDDVAAVAAGVTKVSLDVAALRGELGDHVYNCKTVLASAACPKPRPRPRRRRTRR